jgi:D-sedoheptulose 7-phosphate isomerase
VLAALPHRTRVTARDRLIIQIVLEPRIQQQFFESADLAVQAAEALARPVAELAQAVLGTLTAGGKVLAIGLGDSRFDAQRFAAAFVGRFERDRPPLAALALAADGAATRDEPLARLEKQLQALAVPGDVLVVALSTDDDPSLSVCRALVDVAHDKDLTVVVLGGRDARGTLAAMLRETDVLIAVPHDRPVRVREVHALVLHCVCDAVDLQLMGEQELA